MMHKDVLPACASSIAVLESTQKDMREDMRDLKKDVKKLNTNVTELTTHLGIVLPILNDLPNMLNAPSRDCPIYVEYLAAHQKKSVNSEQPVKVQDSWFLSMVKTTAFKAILTLTVAALLAAAAWIGK